MFSATEEEIQNGSNGACLRCGTIQYGGVEPDARGYVCAVCGECEVYGLEELLIMGEIEIADEGGSQF